MKIIIRGKKVDKNHFMLDDLLDWLEGYNRQLTLKNKCKKKKGGKKK